MLVDIKENKFVETDKNVLNLVNEQSHITTNNSTNTSADASDIYQVDYSQDLYNSSSHSNANNSKVQTTPAVRRIAKEYSIDLSMISGTGPKGRITKEDVLIIVANRDQGFTASSSSVSVRPSSRSNLTSSASSNATVTPPLPTSTSTPTLNPSSSTPINNLTIPDSTNPVKITTTTTKPSVNTSASVRADEYQVVPIRGVQRLMAKNMKAALQVGGH